MLLPQALLLFTTLRAKRASHVLHVHEQPFEAVALSLRRFDEAAKVAGRKTPPLEHFLALVGTLATEGDSDEASEPGG
jgi:predicted HD phosphohydrolase